MAGLVVADRVKETTATTGTGTLTLAGAVAQFQSFGAVGNTNQCNYCILGGNGTDWETGIGTYTLSGTTLSRDTVLASSNSGSKISLTGTSTVFLTEPAASLAAAISASIVPPPVLSNWTQRNISSPAAAANVANGLQINETPSSATPANSLRQLTLAVPATPYTIDMLLGYNGGAATVANASINFGALWTDGTKLQTILNSYISTTTAGVSELFVANFSNSSTFAAAVGVGIFVPVNLSAVWFRLSDNGTTVSLSTSSDGVTFTLLYSVAKASGYLGSSGYTNVGFFISPSTQGSTGWQSSVTLRSWWQH